MMYDIKQVRTLESVLHTTMPSPNTFHTRFASKTLTLTALALTTLLAGALPASAGPDDGKIVTTQAHIDSPKAFWKNGNFTLLNGGSATETGPAPIEQTVIWLGKGWSTYEDGKNQYIFNIENKATQGFLGDEGDFLYMAPAVPTGNHNPAWVGYGADSDIPVEEFRDGTFSLDLLKVEGPGEVEFFTHWDPSDPAGVTRIAGSADKGWQSISLTPGQHSHNYTAFTRPGRYELTYRTVARSKDGSKTISSQPQTMVWQVGGQQPINGTGTANSTSALERYQAAPVGNLVSEKYSLSTTPHTGRERDGDDKLTDITFKAGNTSTEGTLTLYNNGYFLTDLEVTGGSVTWPEMLGSETSTLQAVFTPAGNEDARWISPELAYSFGASNSVSSSEGEGSWPVERNEPTNITLPTGNYTPTAAGYTATLTPHEEEGYSVLEVTFEDPNFRGFIQGGFYGEIGGPASLGFTGNIENGKARYVLDDSGFYDGEHAVLKVVPHPDMNANTSTLEITADHIYGKAAQTTGAFEVTEPPAHDVVIDPARPAQPSPEAITPSPPMPTEPSEPVPSVPAGEVLPTARKCTLEEFAGKYVLDSGHVDIAANLTDQKLSLDLKDETGLITKKSTLRSLDDVVLVAGDATRHKRTPKLADPALDFLGQEGATFYGLPQTQQDGVIWPGYNTQDVDYSALDGGVKLNLEPKSMPDGAHFGVYTNNALGGFDVQADSSKGDTVIDIDFATHAHANWVFTAPGNYSFKAYYSATLVDGTEIQSPAQQLSFAIGKEASDACAAVPLSASAEASLAESGNTPVQPAADPGISAVATVSSLHGETGVQATAGGLNPLFDGNSAQNVGKSFEQNAAQDSAASSGLAHTGFGVLGIAGAGIALLVGGAVLVARKRVS